MARYTEFTEMCPRCESEYYIPYAVPDDIMKEAVAVDTLPPALSRTDNETWICSDCGTAEALEDYFSGGCAAKSEWPVDPDADSEKIARAVKKGVKRLMTD